MPLYKYQGRKTKKRKEDRKKGFLERIREEEMKKNKEIERGTEKGNGRER